MNSNEPILEEDDDDNEDYSQLNASQNRKQKKAGGWQAMGWFKKYFIGFKLLFSRAWPCCLQRHIEEGLSSANANPTQSNSTDMRGEGCCCNVSYGVGQNRRICGANDAEIEEKGHSWHSSRSFVANQGIGSSNIQICEGGECGLRSPN